jgi:GxxExxY protein
VVRDKKANKIIQIAYKGKPLKKTYQPDFICYGEIILEIKAISGLSGIEKAQLRARQTITW